MYNIFVINKCLRWQTMIFNKGKKYVFSKDVYLASDERVEKLSNDQINK